MQNTDAIGCVKEATRILGDKWTPQLLRFFANEDALRFCQIEEFVPGINPRTLSSRLENLTAEGIIEKTPAPQTSRCEYRLTEKGRALTPILRDMEAWSKRYAPATV